MLKIPHLGGASANSAAAVVQLRSEIPRPNERVCVPGDSLR
jgi:hypothetical protein